jgi:predicted transcriptional regulator
MVSRSSRKEFRTSVILTETQFKRVREIARVNDASIAWVLRRAIDCYLEAQGAASMEKGGEPSGATKER